MCVLIQCYCFELILKLVPPPPPPTTCQIVDEEGEELPASTHGKEKTLCDHSELSPDYHRHTFSFFLIKLKIHI